MKVKSKTNYVIGVTYYLRGISVVLNDTIKDDEYPLKGTDEAGNKYSFTLDGKEWTLDRPILSTSPTEFIAPKSKDDTFKSDIDHFLKQYKLNKEVDNYFFNHLALHKQRTILQAIDLLKENGYTITKQF